MLRGMVEAGKVRRAMSTLPLGRADIAAIGHRSAYVQDILACDAADPRWAAIDHRHRVAQVGVPVCSIGGWYDIFLPGQLRDYQALRQAGKQARLVGRSLDAPVGGRHGGAGGGRLRPGLRRGTGRRRTAPRCGCS